MNLKERTKQHLSIIDNAGLKRILKPPQTGSIDLSSNDYLNLANDKRLKAAMIAEIQKNGCGATASRLLRGERAVFAKVEKRFAKFKRTERALFFGSGYAANIGILTTFLGVDDVVFSDELNHASIIDGIRLAKAKKIVFPHNDSDILEKFIEETPCDGQKFLVIESLFSMDGDFAPLDVYARLCRQHNIALIVDEAHAVGVFGKQGSGLIEAFGIESDVFLSINTAGKALGAAGAFVAGSDWAIEYLIQRCRPFIFSTAPLPAVAAALIQAIEIVREEPKRRENLLELSKFLGEALAELDFKATIAYSQIIPIIIGDSKKAVFVANKLQAANFDVRAVRPPTVPDNTARLRVSLNSNLDKKALRKFAKTLKSIL